MIALHCLDRSEVPSPEDRRAILASLRGQGIAEALVLATCARTELYIGQDIEVPGARAAVRHLFRVCSGLESPVLGETEIVAQMKEAWALSRSAGMIGGDLDRLLRHAMRAGKRVRTETEVCRGVVSYAGLAVREASARAAGLGDKRLLVVGAGDMGERVVRELRRTPPKEVVVVSRTLTRARTLADRYGHRAVPMGSVAAELEHSAILIGALSGVIVPIGRFVPRRPLVAVDLGEPPCVPCSLTGRPEVTSVTLTDIVRRCLANSERRNAAIEVAERILDEELERYWRDVARRSRR